MVRTLLQFGVPAVPVPERLSRSPARPPGGPSGDGGGGAGGAGGRATGPDHRDGRRPPPFLPGRRMGGRRVSAGRGGASGPPAGQPPPPRRRFMSGQKLHGRGAGRAAGPAGHQSSAGHVQTPLPRRRAAGDGDSRRHAARCNERPVVRHNDRYGADPATALREGSRVRRLTPRGGSGAAPQIASEIPHCGIAPARGSDLTVLVDYD